MRRPFGAVVAVVLMFAPAATAMQFHFVARGTLTGAQVVAIERAVSFQVDHQVARFWPGAVASFGQTGFPIYVTDWQSMLTVCGPDVLGCHTPTRIVVGDDRTRWLEYALDHEIMETAVDPFLSGHEIADPVAAAYWGVGHVLLTNFVTPAYFSGAPGPKDFLAARRALRRTEHRRRHRRHRRAERRF